MNISIGDFYLQGRSVCQPKTPPELILPLRLSYKKSIEKFEKQYELWFRSVGERHLTKI